jgi:hypothetical protein
MGGNGKKQLSEPEVANEFVLMIWRDIQQKWPQIIEDLRWLSVDVSPKDQSAVYEFTLAVVAVQIQALPNLFPIAQAARLREYILQCISPSGSGSYPRDTIQGYQSAWDESLQRLEIPLYGIASVLFDKREWKKDMEFQGTIFKDPLVLDMLAIELFQLRPFWWKKVAEDYTIIP